MFQTNVVEKVKAHILCSMTFYENLDVYEIKWKNNVERCRPHMIIWRMQIARWVPKATNTHTGFVILIVFPLQQWLHEHVSMLPYTLPVLSLNCPGTLLSLLYLVSPVIECKKEIRINVHYFQISCLPLKGLRTSTNVVRGAFKKRPNVLNSAPNSTESALRLLSAPSVRFWQQTAICPVSPWGLATFAELSTCINCSSD